MFIEFTETENKESKGERQVNIVRRKILVKMVGGGIILTEQINGQTCRKAGTRSYRA